MSLRSSVSAWFKRRRSSHKRLEFREREGNLDAVASASYDPNATRVRAINYQRPERIGRRVDWPREVPRSFTGQSFDYDEG